MAPPVDCNHLGVPPIRGEGPGWEVLFCLLELVKLKLVKMLAAAGGEPAGVQCVEVEGLEASCLFTAIFPYLDRGA